MLARQTSVLSPLAGAMQLTGERTRLANRVRHEKR